MITLIIFKYKNDFKVTIKEIEIDAGPFFYGIDIAPIQIRLDNLTNEEVLCDFDVTVNPTDEMPTYKNNKDFIIFEFPVQSLKSLNQTQLINEKTFYFKGSIWLKIKGNKNWSHQIKYSISVTYKSPIIFISIKNNHFFAINENKIEIVPFFSNLSSKLLFEKYIYNRSDDAKITFLDKIIPLEDNTIKTTYVSKQNKSDGQIIEVLFHKSQNPINNISIKYEFGIINDKCIPVEFHTSSFFKYQSFNFSIFSDTTKNFEKENVIINIGNLSRKVFFFVGNINYFEEPINSDDIHFSYNNNYVHFYFNKNENKYLVSSTYQYAIYFFDVIYEGPISQQDEFEGKLTLTISNITEIVDLKIKINFINFGKSGIECNGMLNEYYYYNNDSESMVKIENINENFAFKQMQNQILISPFCFSYYAKDDSVPKIQYKNGYISEIIYDPNIQIIFEVLGFSQSNALQIFTIDDPKELFNQGKNIYILARIKDRHETFFPIISTNIENTYPFNSIIFRVSVKKAVSLIAQFTNNSEFIEYSNTSLKINFESFISALDKLISNRYYILKSLNFFISTNIPLSSIKNQQETVFNALFKKEDITKCEYVISYENNYQKSINAERENIEKYRKNGFIITSVLKWTETKGITSSTIDELNEYKNEIFNPKRDIKIVYDYELTDTELIEFPEKMTIDLIDQSFSKILYLTYFLPNIIYNITINRIPLNGVINILNQLISIYKWTYNHGDYFPFVIFKKKFKQAYFLMITKIIKSIETMIDLCLGELNDSNIEYVVLPKFRIKNLIIPQFSTRNRSIPYKSKNLNEKINYIFNEKDLTCSVGKSPEASGSILIPYSVEHNKNQYRVTSIEKHAFYNCKIESIGFSPKSCITIFKEFAFENATIKKLTIPLGLKFIEKGCFNQVKCLFDIFIPSENHMFKYIDSKFFLGKSDKNMIKCDILHYVRFDVPEKSIKYFVKNIRYNYYYKIEYKQPQINANDNSIELPKFNRCTNSRLKIRTFVPIKNLFYCFFAELQQPNYHLLNIYYTHLFSIRNASDIQRFHFYPGTRNIYTFIGFSDENTMNNNIDKLEKKSIAIDNAIYKYPYVKKADPLFSPDENLFYVYFKEKNLEVKNYRKCGKSKIFEIENIKDLQRGFKVQQKDFEYYTFIGFSNKNELKTSIQILQKQSQLIEVPTIRIFEGDDVLHDYDYDYDDDDEEVDVFKNLENETGKKKEDLNNNDHEQSFTNTNNATKKESSEEDFDYDDDDY